jgi:hypothetical protein
MPVAERLDRARALRAALSKRHFNTREINALKRKGRA